MRELKIGDLAPNFTLPNQDGAEIALQNFRGCYVVLYFYPKDKTPGCTQEACDFRDAQERLSEAGACVLGISRDSSKTHASFIEKERLNFTLLSDKDAAVAKLYGAWGAKKLYGREYEGAIRSTFLLNPRGEIVGIWRNVKVKGHVDQVLAKLQEFTR